MYVGDALTDFIPANEPHLLQYGINNEMYGTVSQKTDTAISNITVHDGVLFIEKKRTYESEYTVKNNAAKNRNVIIEHRFHPNAKLLENAALLEKTSNAYRFAFPIEKKSEKQFLVAETETLKTTAALSSMNLHDFISYSTNGEMSESVKKAFALFAEKKNALEDARKHCDEVLKKRESLENEQERARNNFSSLATAHEEDAKKQFLEKILSLEKDLSANKIDIEEAEKAYRLRQAEFDSLIRRTKIE